MRFSIPIFVERIRAPEGAFYRVRPLFFSGAVREHERLERAVDRLDGDLRRMLRDIGKNPRHDDLAERIFCPSLEEHTVDVVIELRKRLVRCRMLFVAFEAFDRKVAFCPQVMEAWFDVGRGETVESRASEAMTQHFRKAEKDAEGEEVRPEQFALEGSAWTSVIELDIQIHQRLPEAAREISFASLSAESEVEGSWELESVGRCLDRLYPESLSRALHRDAETAELEAILRHSDRRPVLVLGPPQVGKTSLVHEAVYKRVASRSERRREHSQVWLLSPQRLISGMMFVGQWESRLLAIIAYARKKDHVLYFDDVLGLYQAGQTSQSSLSVAHVIKPYVEPGDVRIVAEMTPEAFRILRERDRGFADLFHVLPLREPDDGRTLRILIGYVRQLEAQHGTRFDLDVLPTVLDLTRRYVRAQAFPGKAASFLQRLATRVRKERVTRDMALAAFRDQTGLALGFLDGRKKLDRADLIRGMQEHVIGQRAAIDAAADAICISKARINDPGRPVGVFLFLGPTGVGKTECAKAMARVLFGSDERLVRFDMNEYGTPGCSARLAGDFSHPEGLLTSAVRRQPFCVLLLDEIEKAHPEVFDLLLQVLGEGRLTDALGRTADFTNALIVMTSNLGVRDAEASLGLRAVHDSQGFVLAAQRHFRPEFFNRIDRVVPFDRLSRDQVAEIARRRIADVMRREGLARRKCVLRIEAEAMDRVVDVGFDPVLGARALKRAIESQLALPIAERLAAGLPETVTEIHVHSRRGNLHLDVRALEETPALPWVDCALPHASSLVEAASRFTRRIEAQFAEWRPPQGFQRSNLSAREMFHLALQDQIRVVRSLMTRYREQAEDARIGGRSMPSLPTRGKTRSFKPAKPWRCGERFHGAVLQEIGAAADLMGYLDDVVDRAEVAKADPEPMLRTLMGQLALLQALADASDRPAGEEIILYVRATSTFGSEPIKALAEAYLRGFLEFQPDADGLDSGELPWWAPTCEWLIEPTADEAAIVVRGIGASEFVAGELGTHLYAHESAGLTAVQVFAWPTSETQSPADLVAQRKLERQRWLGGECEGGDPLALGPVIRIYRSGGRNGIDLATQRIVGFHPNLPSLVSVRLRPPEELLDLAETDQP